MPTITAKPFDPAMQALLGDLTSGYHSGELSSKDPSQLPDEIYIIEDNASKMAGYAVIWEYATGKKLIDKAEKDYFDKDERYLEKEFYTDINNKTDIIFIEALDILKPFEGKGHAAFFINWLKAEYPKNKMYVYTLDRSRNFWFKMGFKVIGKTKWVTFG